VRGIRDKKLDMVEQMIMGAGLTWSTCTFTLLMMLFILDFRQNNGGESTRLPYAGWAWDACDTSGAIGTTRVFALCSSLDIFVCLQPLQNAFILIMFARLLKGRSCISVCTHFRSNVARRLIQALFVFRRCVLYFFSSLMIFGSHKQVKKLKSAAAQSSIVVATPASVKSLMLKYLENVMIANDAADRRCKDTQKEVRIAPEIFELFRSGVCLIDEVDVVLHPLKSELNFPIGLLCR
jgi:hypothetical protein